MERITGEIELGQVFWNMEDGFRAGAFFQNDTDTCGDELRPAGSIMTVSPTTMSCGALIFIVQSGTLMCCPRGRPAQTLQPA